MTRSRLFGFSGFLAFFLVLRVPQAFAADRIAIDETRMRIDIAGKAILMVPVTNSANQPISTNLRLDFLNSHERVVYDLTAPIVAAPGSTVVQVPLPRFLDLKESGEANYGWMRLKYVLPGNAEGIVSVSRIAREPFVMSVVTPHEATPSARYSVQVLARDPSLGTPVANVSVTGKLGPEGEPSIFRRGRTNSKGYAELNFDLAAIPEDSELELEVTGQVGSLVRRVGDTIYLRNRLTVITSTDKPIYQPGQKLRIRALVFDRVKNAVKDLPLTVSVRDLGNDQLFEVPLVTSSFGEVHTEWEIPVNARIGRYQILVESPAGVESSDSVWIGRYDLPNFTVDARSERPFYLPGQKASAEIKADYLFGKPVPQAQVRVIREVHRTWNYRESKWDITEGEVIKGIADGDGRFHASLNIEKDFEELSDRRGSAYDDLNYSAYVTDPSTNRTEQRRFSIRITQNAIHLYALQQLNSGGFPLEIYLSASYADGSSAACDIEILEVRGDTRIRLGTVRTNRYGVARVRNLRPTEPRGDDSDWELEFRANDGQGRVGQERDWFSVDEDVIHVHTDKTLYRSSEPIVVHLEAMTPGGEFILNASHEGRNLYTSMVQFSNGRAEVRIPTSKAFRGEILISAYRPQGVRDSLFGARRVSFPQASGLEIESSSGKTTHAPGDEATLSFHVRNGDGSGEQALLGVSVFDKAVEERARTDNEFGGSGALCPFCDVLPGFGVGLPGLTRSDLARVDRSKPIPPDLDLAAEVVLMVWSRYGEEPETLSESEPLATAFSSTNELMRRYNQLRVSGNYPASRILPKDEASLRAMVLRLDPQFDVLRDPWNNPYRLTSSVSFNRNAIHVVSAGPDEQFDSADDFRVANLEWPYFEEYGKALFTALNQYHERTGGHVRDISTLTEELQRAGEDFETWRNSNGGRYVPEFNIDRTRFTVTIKSEGMFVWTGGTDYTAHLQPRISNALNQVVADKGALPEDDEELKRVLTGAGILDQDLRDPWGRAYYAVRSLESSYVDSTMIVGGDTNKIRIVPVTRQSQVLRLRSAGPDGKENTPDDFRVFTYLKPLMEQSVEDADPRFVDVPALDSTHGAIYGTVIDSSGALIPGVSVKLTSPSGQERDFITSENGDFMLRNVEPGIHQIRASLPGFQHKILTGVVVKAGLLTRVVATLEIAGSQTMVEVSAASIGSGAMEVASERVNSRSASLGPISTPRLREYFPETLLWQPALETGSDGKARIKFNLADSVTTWKAVAIASTKDGRIAVAEKEIVAFQPFFLEHDPPKILTEGDQISLPVVVRSYLDRDQSLDLSMKPEPWFETSDSSSRKLEIKSGEFAREVFTFKAVTPIRDGRQRVTAKGSQASDDIEKASTVLPFGREMTQASSGIFRGTSTYNLTVPEDAFPGSVRAELKIYPNLMSHVVDAIEAIMRRPYGCAEQVISSAYPSLLFLQYNKQTGRKADPLEEKATRYLQTALQTLQGYRTKEGGFSYWSYGEADAAVTAYALQFLTYAKEFLPIDDEIPNAAREWLSDQQASDGSWKGNPELTAYIANVLSTPGILQKGRNPLLPALAYLDKFGKDGDPYVTASVALAALNMRDRQRADSALATLRAMARRERDATFWDLQTNTPFYSWGLPGRLETTAVAVNALSAAGSDPALVDQGLLFLLRNKDRFGVWHSTQATVRVLETLVRLAGGKQSETPGSADVFVNGVRVAAVDFGTRQQPNNPVAVDLSKFFATGLNRVDVVERKKTSIATIQLLESHYVAWDRSSPDPGEGPLRFAVQFSRQEAGIDEPITVRVEAERVGFRGYGMMLGEIGLPPGAEVDRSSLSAAIESSGWSLARYDVLPDRVVVYLWPRAGGTGFEFKFRPRYGLDAHTPASMLYDYYNPDANRVIPPERFRIH